MPYSGPSDPSLPSNVRKLPEKRRRQWLHVYNGERGKGRDDGTAIRIANGVVKGEKTMEDDKETADAPFVDYETKSDGDSGIVEGYASIFGYRDHSKDRILPGAFTKTLAERMQHIVYLPSHDYKIHVKDIPAVPLEVREDKNGLYTSTKFFLNTQAGRDSFSVIKAYQEAKRPLGLSFTFRPTATGTTFTKDGRDLSEVDLFEYGHTPLPMHDMARTISAKADGNNLRHSAEIDHAHNHGDFIHAHSHAHADGYDGMGHMMHDHSEEQMKSLVEDDSPKYWDDDFEVEGKRTFTTEERDKAASSGAAMKDGSYPIHDEEDLKNAIQAVGRAKNYSAAKRHIISRARALGKTSMLPEDWKVSKAIQIISFTDVDDESLLVDFEQAIGKSLDEQSSAKIRAAIAALQSELLLQEEDAAETKNEDDVFFKQKDEIEAALARVRI